MEIFELTIRSFLLMVMLMDTSNSSNPENTNSNNQLEETPAGAVTSTQVDNTEAVITPAIPSRNIEQPPTVEPATTASSSLHAVASPPDKRSAHKVPLLLTLALAIAGLMVGAGGGYVIASSNNKKPVTNTNVAVPNVEDKELKVPEGATVISECAKGRGKQYVLPQNIPQGPVYNVHNGKVTSVEYMLSQKDVLANKDYLNLPLENVKYEHVNIGLLSKGHSGFPEPHYHVDVFTVSHEEAVKITCE